MIFLIMVICPLSAVADNAWYVSIPKSRFDPSAPWGNRFQYTSILYLTEQGLNSTQPLNYSSCATNGCYVAVNTQSAENPAKAFNLDPGHERVFFRGSTVGEALTALYNRLGSMTYTTDSTAPDRTNEGITWCGAVSISPTGSGASYVVMNGGECGKLPPPNVECALLTSDTYLDHGTLSVAQIKDSSQLASDTFKIRCNRDTNVLLSIISPDESKSTEQDGTRIVFEDGGGLVSYLKINNKSALTPTSFSAKGNSDNVFTVTSRLKIEGDKVSPGPFYSFAYIILSYE
ncbi:hypothetical protein [Providencia rettgeri]|uniref:MrpH family fimbial adhesin n=1 Tax=Providencia rettgeri TaxID=587 RepID=UPI001EFE1712|nr:hypothetical protein [Providencia rettgeri]MCG9528597.1 hypothetical protein [Providencia rettgeri]